MPQFRIIVGQSNAVCIKVIKCPAHRGAGMLKNRNGDKFKCGGHKLLPSLIGIGLFYVVPKSPYVPAALSLNSVLKRKAQLMSLAILPAFLVISLPTT